MTDSNCFAPTPTYHPIDVYVMTSFRLLPAALSDILGLSDYGILGDVLGGLLGGVAIVTFLLVNAALVIWAKRKTTAAFTDRIAVNRVGPFGLFIIVADAVRLMSKELVIPDGVDRPAYNIAPLVLPFSAFLGFAVIPMGHLFGVRLQLADPEIGVVYLFAVASLATLGLTMAEYASNNKYALMGGLRAIAQNIAYEIPLIVTAASVVLFVGSLQTSKIVAAQQEVLFTIAGLTIPAWLVFVNLFAYVLFLVANLAEVGRNPFDIPEASTELVAGYQTEYSSIYWTLMYMGEFLHMFLGSHRDDAVSRRAIGSHTPRIRLVCDQDVGVLPVRPVGTVSVAARPHRSTHRNRLERDAGALVRKPRSHSTPSAHCQSLKI
jgi:NADH-quinone oxidoreductase subunit H